jgi:hypothetical protein
MSAVQPLITVAPPLLLDGTLSNANTSLIQQNKKTNKMRIDFRAVTQLYKRVYPTVRLFREHFGATPDVACSTWEWLVVSDLLPPKALPCHLLWLFYWWKSNPLQGPCCEFLGGIDKNTFIKWHDLMEVAVSNLPVVSKQ